MDLRSDLGKVKDASHAQGGSHHWIFQRITALAIIPLVIWFVVTIVCAVTNPQKGALEFLQSPISAMAMVLFLSVMIYHGSLGIRVVYEDYISNKFARNCTIIITNFISIALVLLSIISVVNFHINNSDLKTRNIDNINVEKY